MSTGKEKCEMLKAIRKQIAERYNLEYTPSECTHKGNCLGTCPKCDAELRDLQEQLERRGITDIDWNVEIPEEESSVDPEDSARSILQGDVESPKEPELIKVTMGLPAPQYLYRDKKRVLYKECQVAGITFHNLEEVWDELYEGAELALVREKDNKHDKYAIAVALADDYDGEPDDFDFDYILGYVPRSDNKDLADMMDMGWAEAFECELSQVNGSNPYKGSLWMKIYIVSKDEEEYENTEHLLHAMELDDEAYEEFTTCIENHGCAYFRWGGFQPCEYHNFPKKGDKVVFIHKGENISELYLMYCIAVGDDNAAYFVEDKTSLHAIDDSCYYVFTTIHGPLKVSNNQISFLEDEIVCDIQADEYLSENASTKLQLLFDSRK